jgi:3-oxoacyl-[acyl-carrier-protein] synthase-3
LGLDNPGAFDISAACSGFPYAIGLADSMISTGQANNVLVIGVEKLTDWTDPHDRGTAFIFADGAGAVVVSPSDEPGVGPTVWGSNGGESEAIICLPDWNQLRAQHKSAAIEQWPVLHMQGQKVFRWAVSEMVPIAKAAIEAAGLTPADLQLFVPHQANNRITDAMVRALDFPDTIAVARDITTSGNTSAASIPLALDRLREEGVAHSGDLALFIGFGAGLAYAAQVVRIP